MRMQEAGREQSRLEVKDGADLAKARTHAGILRTAKDARLAAAGRGMSCRHSDIRSRVRLLGRVRI